MLQMDFRNGALQHEYEVTNVAYIMNDSGTTIETIWAENYD